MTICINFDKNSKFISALVVTLTAFVTTSCAQNKPKEPAIKEVFTTHIDEDGNKKFQYQVNFEKGGRGAKGGGKGGGRGKGGPGGKERGGPEGRGPKHNSADEKDDVNREEKMQKMVDEKLNKMIQTTGYCLQGYDVIDQEIREKNAIVNAQCINKASDEDRKRFPNKDNKPVVIEEDLEAM